MRNENNPKNNEVVPVNTDIAGSNDSSIDIAEANMIEKMKRFADVSSDIVKTIIAKTEQSMIENKRLNARLSKLKKYEDTIQQFQNNFELLKTYGNVSSPGDMVMNYPLSQEYINELRSAIHGKVDTLLIQFPQWNNIRTTFVSYPNRSILQRFKTNKLYRTPALIYEELLNFVDEFDFLKNLTHLSLALLNFRAKNNFTQEDAADLIGVHRGTYSRWERGQTPKISNIYAIAALLGKTPENITLMGESKLSGNNFPMPNIQKNDIAVSLKKARKEKGYSYLQAAKEIGVTRATYYRWETGRHHPSNKHKVLVEKFIGHNQEPVGTLPDTVKHLEIAPITIETVENLPQKLQKIRLQKGYNLRESAKEIGVPLSTYYQWEKGKYKPKPKYMPAIRRFLESQTNAEVLSLR